jgi:hypothetical protein
MMDNIQNCDRLLIYEYHHHERVDSPGMFHNYPDLLNIMATHSKFMDSAQFH